jgi:hypothetical protein
MMSRFVVVSVLMATIVVNCSGTAYAVPAVDTAAAGTANTEPMQSVQVSAMSNPEIRSYRYVAAGLDAFDEFHRLAPKVKEVQFVLHAKRANALAGADPLELKIIGAGPAIMLAISDDGRFTVPRSEQAYDDDADIVLNRKKGNLQAKPDIRTPGLPEHVRRLGDLRLECKVSLAIVKKEMSFLARAAVTTLLTTSDWCGVKGVQYRFATERPANGATLAFADRKLNLRNDGENFFVPLADPSWPDDALIELGTAP